MIGYDELYDEYLSQPTDILRNRIQGCMDMIADLSFASAIYFSEPNLASMHLGWVEDSLVILQACEREMIERGFETD